MVQKEYISLKVPEMNPAKPSMSMKPRAYFSMRSGTTWGENEGTKSFDFNSLGAQRTIIPTELAKGFEGQPQISEKSAYKQLANRTELIVDKVIEPQAEERTRAKDSLTPRETKADPKLLGSSESATRGENLCKTTRFYSDLIIFVINWL